VKTLSNTFVIASAVVLVASWQLSTSSGDPASTGSLDLLLKQRSYLMLEKALTSGANLSPSDRAFFEGIMDNRRNRATESITLLEPLIPALSATNQARALIALSTLADDYEKTFQYAAAANTYANLAQNFAPYMSADQVQKARREAKRWNLLRTAPAQSSTVNRPFTVETTRDRLGLVETSVLVAGQPTSMILDTGANLSVISRSTAQRLGLNLLPGQSTMEGMAGNEMLVRAAVVPELQIASATFRNVAVIVAEDTDLFVTPMQYALPGSLGFPILSALGRITFFSDGRFGVDSRDTASQPVRGNLFLQRLTPVVSAGIRGKEELFTIDTGATGSLLSARYYKDHAHDFDSEIVDEVGLTGAGGTRSIPAYFASQLTLSLGGACVHLDEVPVLIESRGTSDNYFYGNLGQDALRLFPSYTFDFRQMNFTVDGPACEPSD
jgi:predicted aspartyl protease